VATKDGKIYNLILMLERCWVVNKKTFRDRGSRILWDN